MGYRSDVVMVMYAPREEHAAAIKLWIKENFPWRTWDERDCIAWLDNGLLFRADNIKWYDGYPEVDEVNRVRREFVDLFCNYEVNGEVDDVGVCKGAYEYIRVGEEFDDIEIEREGADQCYLYTATEIVVDLPAKKKEGESNGNA